VPKTTTAPPAETGRGGTSAAFLGTAALVGDEGDLSALPTAATLTVASATILGAFERFLETRELVSEQEVADLLAAEYGTVPEDMRLDVVAGELDREKSYRAKVRERLDRDLPRVLSIANRELREFELMKVLERERRIIGQREDAIAGRALGAMEAQQVRQASPAGGFWLPSPHVSEHTVDCLAMGWKVWPWAVLDRYHPPLHHGCQCELKTIEWALATGQITPESIAPPAEAHEMALRAMQVMEADIDEGQLVEEFAALVVAVRGGHDDGSS
jgi:hypothetical protein